MTLALPVTPLNKAQLTISNASSCKGIWKDGDHVSLKATYTLSRAIKIKSS
jgi:hypothetical protein